MSIPYAPQTATRYHFAHSGKAGTAIVGGSEPGLAGIATSHPAPCANSRSSDPTAGKTKKRCRMLRARMPPNATLNARRVKKTRRGSAGSAMPSAWNSRVSRSVSRIALSAGTTAQAW
jgi:hypothetical protein